MNYVTKSNEKVAVASKDDAKVLMRALSEHDCRDNVARQDVVGKETQVAFLVSFEDESIGTIGVEDAQVILRWMLDLGVEAVTIERVKA